MEVHLEVELVKEQVDQVDQVEVQQNKHQRQQVLVILLLQVLLKEIMAELQEMMVEVM